MTAVTQMGVRVGVSIAAGDASLEERRNEGWVNDPFSMTIQAAEGPILVFDILTKVI